MSCADASDRTGGPGRQEWFATTHWSVVLTAKEGDALEKLCRAYWSPLYAYIRRDGHDATEAQDLTQEFFCAFAGPGVSPKAPPSGVKVPIIPAHLPQELSIRGTPRAGAQKRGGGCVVLSLNQLAGEDGYLIEPVDELTPDEVFERRWAFSALAPKSEQY